MPVHPVRGRPGCAQWGGHGHVYCGPGAGEKAAAQGRAAYAHGYKGHARVVQSGDGIFGKEILDHRDRIALTTYPGYGGYFVFQLAKAICSPEQQQAGIGPAPYARFAITRVIAHNVNLEQARKAFNDAVAEESRPPRTFYVAPSPDPAVAQRYQAHSTAPAPAPAPAPARAPGRSAVHRRQEVRLEQAHYGAGFTMRITTTDPDAPLSVTRRTMTPETTRQQAIVDVRLVAYQLSEKLRKDNPNPVRVIDEHGRCVALFWQGQELECPPENVVRAARPVGPAPPPFATGGGRAGWRQIELRVKTVSRKQLDALGLDVDQLLASGPYYVIQKLLVDPAGKATTEVLRDATTGEPIWYSGERVAHLDAQTFASAYAAQEPRNPNPVRALDERGRCFYAARGAVGQPHDNYEIVDCADAPAVGAGVRRIRVR